MAGSLRVGTVQPALADLAKTAVEVAAIDSMVFDRTQRVRWAQPQRPQMPQLVSQALAVPETDAEYAERVAEERAAAGRRSAERAQTAIRYVTPGHGVLPSSRRGAFDPINSPAPPA